MVRSSGTFPKSEEHTKHSDNLAELKRSRKQIERLHKAAIRDNSESEIMALSQIQYMLLGIETEATLRKIVTDPTGLSTSQQDLVWQKRSKAEQWLELLRVAFERHYNHAAAPSWTVDSLGSVDHGRYESMCALVDEQLRPVIERRNKLAHGQWLWHLKSGQDNKFKQESRQGPPPDYFTLYSLTRAVESIAELILILTVSRPTFERDYDRQYQAFYNARADIDANRNGSRFRKFAADLEESLPADRKAKRRARRRLREGT